MSQTRPDLKRTLPGHSVNLVCRPRRQHGVVTMSFEVCSWFGSRCQRRLTDWESTPILSGVASAQVSVERFAVERSTTCDPMTPYPFFFLRRQRSLSLPACGAADKFGNVSYESVACFQRAKKPGVISETKSEARRSLSLNPSSMKKATHTNLPRRFSSSSTGT